MSDPLFPDAAAFGYIRDLYAVEDAALHFARSEAARIGRPITISPEQGRLLQCLIRLGGLAKAVEIGTLTGYSALWIARALPDGGRLYAVEKERDCIDIAASTLTKAEMTDRVEFWHGDAIAQLEKLTKHGPFDLVFIDADKGNYPAYLDWAETNLRSGGLVVADNTLLSGAVWNRDDRRPAAQAIRDVNRRLADTTRFTSILLPIRDGMTVAVKR